MLTDKSQPSGQRIMPVGKPNNLGNILQWLYMMTHEGVVNGAETADFSRDKPFNLFQGSVPN